jgi:hypothetical protein
MRNRVRCKTFDVYACEPGFVRASGGANGMGQRRFNVMRKRILWLGRGELTTADSMRRHRELRA